MFYWGRGKWQTWKWQTTRKKNLFVGLPFQSTRFVDDDYHEQFRSVPYIHSKTVVRAVRKDHGVYMCMLFNRREPNCLCVSCASRCSSDQLLRSHRDASTGDVASQQSAPRKRCIAPSHALAVFGCLAVEGWWHRKLRPSVGPVLNLYSLTLILTLTLTIIRNSVVCRPVGMSSTDDRTRLWGVCVRTVSIFVQCLLVRRPRPHCASRL